MTANQAMAGKTIALPKAMGEAPAPTMLEARRIFALVEGHFDEEKGCYTGDYTDARVATELNLPRAMITRVREEGGLKIKGDPELIAIREMTRGVEDRLRKYEFRMAS